MTFASRQDAGRRLGKYLAEIGVRTDLVVGLPRGGVVVAAEVADLLACPLDVLAVRKIGHPHFREFAVGALGEGGLVVLDEAVLKRAHLDKEELDAVIAEEAQRLESYRGKFARPKPSDLEGKLVTVVDDGLATGATLEAGVRSVRAQGARRIIAAVPVASTSGAQRIARVCDAFHALLIDPDFQAVGQYYQEFQQTTDEEVRELLDAHPL